METDRPLPPTPTKGDRTQAEMACASGSLHTASAPRGHSARSAASAPSHAHPASVLSYGGTAGALSAASAPPKSGAAGALSPADGGAPTNTLRQRSMCNLPQSPAISMGKIISSSDRHWLLTSKGGTMLDGGWITEDCQLR